ncbi:hypothetical protein H4Q26_017946 [Puccinia striiformis f. sp. tritici PST-130]|nr:hypothetical protein H4Q26_017946 [Puccinia striiformis f. sp. tritici PST-130]
MNSTTIDQEQQEQQQSSSSNRTTTTTNRNIFGRTDQQLAHHLLRTTTSYHSQYQKDTKLHKLTSIPKLRRASSKVFSQFPHPFTTSSSIETPAATSQATSNPSHESDLIETIQASSPTLIEHSRTNYYNKDSISDYDPITSADIRSFEDDGQEGSLQDALDLGDPNSITDTIVTLTTTEEPDRESLLASNSIIHLNQQQQQHYHQTHPLQQQDHHHSTPSSSSSTTLNPVNNTAHSLTTYSLSTQSSELKLKLTIKTSLTPRSSTAPKPSTAHLGQPSRESALSIVANGPAALPSRLSGCSPRSPELSQGGNQNQKGAHLKGNSTPPEDHQVHRSTLVDPRRSPNSSAHLAPSNIRGLGSFFDKAVNYMFDTDAHSYDSRLTTDLWIIGGQQFSGVWKWEEVHDEGPFEDLGLPSGNGNTGTGSGSDASHNPPISLKKRTGLRRVTVTRKSFEVVMPGRKNVNTPISPSSPSPSPEPSFGVLSSHNSTPHPSKVDDATLLPASVTHSYPPVFYHAFASIIGLTYRTDFPPIPCTSDRSKSSAIGAAGARVGGMLATLSLNIGRTGKKPRSGQGGSRSPSPHRHPNDRADDDDRTSDSTTSFRGLNSDVGWGCMLRTGQSMLANALLVTHLGRDWRRPITSITSPSSSASVDPLYARLLSWFIDSSSPLAPFSVHHFTSKGKELGKEVGEWFGPSTAAGAIKALTNQFLAAGLGVATDVDGTVYRSDVFNASSFTTSSRTSVDHPSSSTKTTWQRPVLVLINVRLGLDGVNPVYYEAIKATFTFPQSVGIAGGRPSSSYYFCGHQGDSLFYIDPHHSRPAIPFEEPPRPLMLPAQKINLNPRHSFGKQDRDWEQVSSTDTDSLMSGSAGSEKIVYMAKKSQNHSKNQPGNSSSISVNLRREQLDDFYASAYPNSALQSFHPEKVRRMNLSALDPSMLLGFLVRDEAEWEDLTSQVTPAWMRSNVESSNSRTSADFRPSDDSDLGVDSWSEPEDWGTNSRTEDHTSSSGPNSQSTGMEDNDESMMDGRLDDTESSTNVDSMSIIDDEGWDNIESGSVKPDRNQAINSPQPIEDSNPSNSHKAHRLTQPILPIRVSSRNAFGSTHGRAQSVNIQQTFPQGTSTIRSVQSPYRHTTIVVVVLPTSQLNPTPTVSPTHHQHSSSTRDEPRARNISAATVRARQSDDQLADSEETLNHRERRRLDSQGSLRPLRA